MKAIALILAVQAAPFATSRLDAQEAGSSESLRSLPDVPRFFPEPVDFWRSGLSKERRRAEAGPEGKEILRESIWAEPAKLPDGRTAIYVPPKAVLDFLENPTVESLKGYLEWKRARAEKLAKALRLLEEERAREAARRLRLELKPPGVPPPTEPDEREADPAPAPLPPSAGAIPAPGTLLLTYFHRKGCPPCERQDVVLARWLGAHPEVRLKVLEWGESPELWRAHGIEGTPSLLFEFEDSRTKRVTLVRGLADGTRLDRALAECIDGDRKKEKP